MAQPPAACTPPCPKTMGHPFHCNTKLLQSELWAQKSPHWEGRGTLNFLLSQYGVTRPNCPRPLLGLGDSSPYVGPRHPSRLPCHWPCLDFCISHPQPTAASQPHSSLGSPWHELICHRRPLGKVAKTLMAGGLIGEWQAQTGPPPLCSRGSTESSAPGSTVAHTRFSTLLPEFYHRPPQGRAAAKDLGTQGGPWKVGAP